MQLHLVVKPTLHFQRRVDVTLVNQELFHERPHNHEEDLDCGGMPILVSPSHTLDHGGQQLNS